MSAPTNDDSHLWVTWDDYNRLIERLALQVHQSGWQFDKILCLARGGVRVGDVMSRIFDAALGILATRRYREAAGTKQVIWTSPSSSPSRAAPVRAGVAGGRHGGHRHDLQQVFDHLKNQFAEITELRSAVLWWKGHSQATPDYYVDKLPANPWIHQPFEDYDSLRPHNSKLDPPRAPELSRRIARRQGGAGRRLCPVYGQNPAARARDRWLSLNRTWLSALPLGHALGIRIRMPNIEAGLQVNCVSRVTEQPAEIALREIVRRSQPGLYWRQSRAFERQGEAPAGWTCAASLVSKPGLSSTFVTP